MEGRIDEAALGGTALGELLQGKEFGFQGLTVRGVDNSALLMDLPDLGDQEISLFHKSISSGDEYVLFLANRLECSLEKHRPLPVVRFADGEYAFYAKSLKCNGLYKQAESVRAISKALPSHVCALRELSKSGILAPLVFPGNILPRSWFFILFSKKGYNDQAIGFIEFLRRSGAFLTGSNYVPFYVVYAYLSSTRFAAAMDGKRLCIVNSDFDSGSCSAFFERAGSSPRLHHVPIPTSFVATQWNSMRDNILGSVPDNPDCFMVGAGVGALEVCVELARLFSVPAIDSGHILNMMNGLLWKSAGPRLFTHKP